MKKILYLDVDMDDFGDFFRENRNKVDEVDSFKVYRNYPDFLRKIILFLGLKISKRFLWLIYDSWKYRIDAYQHIIIPSRKSCIYAIEKISKEKKVIVYYWNLVSDKEIDPQTLKNNKNVFLCSFDPGDSKKYGMRFVDTYLFNITPYNTAIKSDAFYVGIIRPNRKETLEMLSEELHKSGKITDFHIMKFNDKKNRLTYRNVLEHTFKTRAIIDLTRDHQVGLTLRPIESLIFNKKLITNNKYIKNYNFYNHNNIFILGEDNISSLCSFIDSPVLELDEKIKEAYFFEKWVYRVIDYDKFI